MTDQVVADRVGVVIVGAGIAGVSAAGALRAAGHQGEIILLGDEPELPYRRPPVSKEIVRGDKAADQIRIKPAEWYEKHGVDLRTGARVGAVDVEQRELTLEDGSTVSYDQLLLATGGRARTLAGTATGARTLRGLADVGPLTAAMTPGARVVVVGAGLIGSEIAASARSLGCEVTLLESADLPLPRLLPPALGRMYVALHDAEGTDLQTDVTVRSVEDGPDGTTVHAEDGRSWTAPLVVLAVGMQPNVELAEAAGITVAPDAEGGGIVVDEHGRTSIEGIYAAGDVAQMPNSVLGGRHRVEHWQNAQNHGAAVGKAMAGQAVAFDEVPWCWSDQYGHTLQVTGWPQSDHELVLRGSLADLDFTALFLADDVIRGAVALGRPADIRTARRWIAARQRLDPRLLADADVDLGETLAP